MHWSKFDRHPTVLNPGEESSEENRIFLIGKPSHVARISEIGISLTGGVEKRIVPSPSFIVSDTIDESFLKRHKVSLNPVVFITTKASDAAKSILPFRAALLPLSPDVVCLQNGLGAEKEVNEHFDIVWKGQVFASASKMDDERIHVSLGVISIQTNAPEFSIRLQKVFDCSKGHLSLEISENLSAKFFQKLAINCAFNPLTIIFNETVGWLATHKKDLIYHICKEIHSVADSGVASAKEMTEIALSLSLRLSHHRSSMFLDHSLGKETEIDFLNGAIVRIAGEKGISVPINAFLTNTIKEISKHRASSLSVEAFYVEHEPLLEEIKKALTAILPSD